MMGYGEVGWMAGFGWLWMVLVWAIVIGVVVWAVGAPFGTRDRAAQASPLDTLKRRYAAGEISTEEFEQAKRALI
jgi:putative membrane protein